MGLRLFFLPNFPGATFIQEAAFIPDSRVLIFKVKKPDKNIQENLLCVQLICYEFCMSRPAKNMQAEHLLAFFFSH